MSNGNSALPPPPTFALNPTHSFAGNLPLPYRKSKLVNRKQSPGVNNAIKSMLAALSNPTNQQFAFLDRSFNPQCDARHQSTYSARNLTAVQELIIKEVKERYQNEDFPIISSSQQRKWMAKGLSAQIEKAALENPQQIPAMAANEFTQFAMGHGTKVHEQNYDQEQVWENMVSSATTPPKKVSEG